MIKLTDDQQEIVDYLIEQVDNPEGHNVIVSGSGGTGKTTMVCELISQLLEQGYRIAVTAMTGKATAVLRGKVRENIREKGLKVEKDHLLIETVTKLTKESKVLGLTESGETLYTGTWRDPKGFAQKYDVLFIDEMSMVPHFISQWWQMSGIRVFGFGDECQLPEVTTNETKRELAGFRHDLKAPEMKYIAGYGVKVLKDMAHMQLHKVLRSDNEIALLCGEMRDFTQTRSQMIGRVKKWAAETDNIQYAKSVEDIELGNDWQIICYTNKMCQTINNQLCIGGDYPALADKIILFDNLNPIGRYNGDTMTFESLLRTIKSYNDRNKTKLYVCVKWQGKMPSKDSPNPLERGFFATYVQFKREIELVNQRRLYALPGILRSTGRAKEQIDNWIKDIETIRMTTPKPEIAFIEVVQKFQDVDLDIAQLIMETSEPLPRLYMVTVDYGYAITTHKSQGSEYPQVCYILEKFDKPLFYTGVSRAKVKVKVVDLTK